MAKELARSTIMSEFPRPVLLVLASTYPRWANDAEPGFVHELARRLVGRFHVIALVPHAPGSRVKEDLDGVEIIRYRYAPERWETLVNDGGIMVNLRRDIWKMLLVPGFVILQAWHAWRLIQTRRISVLHAHWLVPQGLVAALLSRSLPFAVTCHGADLFALRGRWLDSIKRLVVRRASVVSVVSRAMHDKLELIDAETEKVSILPMGVDLEQQFRPVASALRSLGEILFVGRLVEKKGLRYLVAAMPRILTIYPEASLTIAGFGPEESVLKKQVAQLAIEEKVRFLGAVPQTELPDLYRRAAVFVAPFIEAESGDQEGLGLVLVEAIGCLCPVIVGDVPAVRDVIDEDSWLIDVTNADMLSAAVLSVMRDPEVAYERVQRLREQLRVRMDWRSVADRYAEMLTDISSGSMSRMR